MPDLENIAARILGPRPGLAGLASWLDENDHLEKVAARILNVREEQSALESIAGRVTNYNPDQPRLPSGGSGGGRWAPRVGASVSITGGAHAGKSGVVTQSLPKLSQAIVRLEGGGVKRIAHGHLESRGADESAPAPRAPQRPAAKSHAPPPTPPPAPPTEPAAAASETPKVAPPVPAGEAPAVSSRGVAGHIGSVSLPENRRKDFDESLAAIDSVLHMPPDLQRLPLVETGPGEKSGGGFHHVADRPLRMFVPTLEAFPHNTMIHELGHWLDFSSGMRNRHAAEYSAVVEAARSSDLMKKVGRIKDVKMREYMQKPHEMFARAFAQYIAVKSGSDKLVRQTQILAQEKIPETWKADDFIPIHKALDTFFGKAGILKSPVSAANAAGSFSQELTYESIAERILNYSPDQPRDKGGKWASGGGGGGSRRSTMGLMSPINIKPEQRAQLTKEERDDWNKTWRSHDNAKKAAAAEKDPGRKAQLKAEEDRLMERLKDIRSMGQSRLSGSDEGKVAGKAEAGKTTSQTQGEEAGGQAKTIDHAREAIELGKHIAGVGRITGDLVHLGVLRRAMRHLDAKQFEEVVQHARLNNLVTLSGPEGRHGLTARDKQSAIYEKDPLGGPDKMLLYASLRGQTSSSSGTTSHGTGGIGTTAKSSTPGVLTHDNPQNLHQALDNAFDAGRAVFGEHAFARSEAGSSDLLRRIHALGSADINSFDLLMNDPHLKAKAAEAVKKAQGPGGSGGFHDEYLRKLGNIVHTFERGPKDDQHKQSMVDKLKDLKGKIEQEVIPALEGTGQWAKAAFYAKHGHEVINHLIEHIKSSGVVGGQVTLDHVLERIKATGVGRSEYGPRSDHIEAVAALMDEHSKVAGDVQAHGMNRPDATQGMVVDGTQFHWTEKTKVAAAESLANLAYDRLPPKLWAATERVVFSGQRNKDDKKWEATYGIPGFKSHATGGDGTIVVYNGNSVDRGDVAHESGHNLATRIWGSPHPSLYSGSPEYAKAQKVEPAVSSYGMASAAEDFAEAARMYSDPVGHARLKRTKPKKYAALKDLIGEWDPSTQGQGGGKVVSNYSPEQSRDEKGMWTTGGGAPKKLTSDEIASRLSKASDHFGEVRRIMSEYSRPAGSRRGHGMKTAEEVRELLLDGVRLQWSEGATSKVEYTLLHFAHKENQIPPKLLSANYRIQFTTQANKADWYWQRRLKSPSFTSAATAGDGIVVSYNESMDSRLLAHESGHNFAKKMWGRINPPPDSDYGKAQKAEKPVTEYGATNPAEDFAEACMMYSHRSGQKKLQKGFPLKYQALVGLLGRWRS